MAQSKTKNVPVRDEDIVFVNFKTTAASRRNLRYLANGSGLTISEVLNRILEATFDKNKDYLVACRRREDDNLLVL